MSGASSRVRGAATAARKPGVAIRAPRRGLPAEAGAACHGGHARSHMT